MEERGNFLIQPGGRIGKGAFGYVEHVQLYTLSKANCSGNYARKVFSPSINVDIVSFKKRFRKEVISQDTCRHKNVAPIYLCNLEAENPWFIMGFAMQDLQSEIDSKSLSLSDKIKILNMILSGINHIHKKGYIHRDIKPNNILKYLDNEEVVYKISDFGLIKNTNPKENTEILTALNVVMGTDTYRAPEIIYSAKYSFQSDIFALGMLMKALKFENASIEPVIKKSTEFELENRYNSVEEIIEDIAKINWEQK